jgi:hypothetical protein
MSLIYSTFYTIFQLCIFIIKQNFIIITTCTISRYISTSLTIISTFHTNIWRYWSIQKITIVTYITSTTKWILTLQTMSIIYYTFPTLLRIHSNFHIYKLILVTTCTVWLTLITCLAIIPTHFAYTWSSWSI